MATVRVTDRPRLVAIRATALFDGRSETLLAEPTVVVDGSTVVTVGPAIEPPDGAVTVDLAGATRSCPA
jgi:imidazolonepropionase-like amidohydrolase